MRVLILGGTGEGRELAGALPGFDVVSSLAGRTAAPVLPEGDVRVGGFGGGLADYLRVGRFDAVVDATHPFAAGISAAAASATTAVGVPLLRLVRPPWTERPGDDWRRVPSLEAAAALAPTLGERLFLAVGSGGLAAFAGVDAWCLARTVERPAPPLPRRLHVVRERGPFTVDGERDLLTRHAIDVVVARDSGGAADAKLTACRELRLPVVLAERPREETAGTRVSGVSAAVAWLSALAGRCP
ncbi:precorrin-6A reductase [Virgisporangium aliadipatigenens]|uniref:Precorrin-6A reductase n=1 Tax=Virgisporangium aliadipatigenens TaxID=741659 RepID=A0A8J3YH44_9ACTN|nr:cobalt-precorrin-6A reductase [Virgisporangium aliadipatigenens]GIJ43925.1 precorrin-6A reductase [Virgisporangium aliadipatigenens]